MEIMRLPPETREKIRQEKCTTLYTRLQIRDALTILYSLIIVLRTSNGSIRLDRIGSNRLEELFGKTRVWCRKVNTMKGPCQD
jgi:hypothetical protein